MLSFWVHFCTTRDLFISDNLHTLQKSQNIQLHTHIPPNVGTAFVVMIAINRKNIVNRTEDFNQECTKH